MHHLLHGKSYLYFCVLERCYNDGTLHMVNLTYIFVHLKDVTMEGRYIWYQSEFNPMTLDRYAFH
jgi:hypothetical protein